MNKKGLKDVLRNYWRVAKNHKFIIIANWFFLIAASVTEIFSPVYIKKFFDILALPIPRNEIYQKAYGVLFIIIALVTLRFLIRRSSSFFHRRIFNKIEWGLYYDAYIRTLEHSHSFFISQPAGSIAHKIDKYRASFVTLWEKFSIDILTNIVRAIGFTTVLFMFNKTIGWIMLVWLVVFILSNFWYSKIIKRNLNEISILKSGVSGNVVDGLSNHMTIQLFNGYEFEKNNIWKRVSNLIKLYRKRSNNDDLFFGFQAAFTTISEIAMFIIGLYYFKLGLVTVGFFYLSYTYIKKLADDMWTISRIFRQMSEAYIDAIDMIQIMEKPYEVTDSTSIVPLKSTKGEIDFENVGYIYSNNNTKVLDDFNLKINPGQKVGLVGSSGAGKSTFVKLLFRLFDVKQGSIKIDNVNIKDISQKDLHRVIGFVPQDSMLFHRTIKENITYGNPNATEQEILNASIKAHCHEFISKLPNGYDTLVGERGVKLSGGERQRIAIARAILKSAPILVLDEATSALDSETEVYIQESLDELMSNKTVIAIAHRLSTIKKMDRILVLENGKILEDGSHEELLKDPNSTYKKLWDLQAGGFIQENED